MTQAPADYSDPRHRYAHQAYDVTYLGKSLESGVAGYGQRLSAVYQASIQFGFKTEASLGPRTIGTLTQQLYTYEILNHIPKPGAVLTLRLLATDTQPAIDLLTDFDMSAQGKFPLDNPLWAPLPTDRVMQAICSGTGIGAAIMSLLVTPAEGGWK